MNLSPLVTVFKKKFKCLLMYVWVNFDIIFARIYYIWPNFFFPKMDFVSIIIWHIFT